MTALPFLWLALSFIAGIVLHPFYVKGVFWPLLIGLIPLLTLLRSRKIFWVFLCAGFVFLGMVFSHLDRMPPKTSLERALGKRESTSSLPLIGKVKTEPEIKTYGRKQTVSFIFESHYFLTYQKNTRPKRHRAEGNVQVFLNQPGKIPEIGDTLRLWGRIEALPQVINPGGFDYKRYLEARDIHFILNVYGPASVRLLARGSVWSVSRFLSNIRTIIRARINYLFSGYDALLIRALILGDRKDLKGKLLDDFLKTGTSHLLAISGLNISLVAGSLYLVLIVLKAGQKKAALAALLTAVFQVSISGFGIPVQRAGMMACLGFLALVLERERSGLNIFSLALLVLLMADTRSLENISFQLSFLSLFCLILFSHFWNQKGSWGEAWVSSAAVLAGTFPVVLYHFNTFSPMGIVTNILGIPFFHFILLTAFFALGLGSIPGLGLGFLWLCRGFIQLGLEWIHFCAQADWGYFYLVRPSWTQMIFYYLLLGLFIFSLTLKNSKSWYWRGTFLGLWLLVAGTFFIPKQASGFEMTLFAAGSNDMAHIQFGEGNQWLINSGRTFPGDQARWILEPYLRSRGIKKLKGVLLTDYRKKHTAGLETLERSFQWEYQVYPALRKRDRPPEQKKTVWIQAGSRIRMPEGGVVEILGHERERLTFRVTVKGQRFLFLPELTYPVFQQLMREKDRRTDLLILPADSKGDKTILKSILTLTRAHSVISSKMNSDFLKILEDRKIQKFDLSKQGAVKIVFDPGNEKKLMIQTFLGKG